MQYQSMADSNVKMRRTGYKAIAPLSDELETAIQWSIRLSADVVKDGDHEAFADWLRLSPTNLKAWRTLSQSMSAFDVAGRHQSRPGAFAEHARQQGVSKRQILRGIVGLCAIGSASALATNRFVPLENLTADHLTFTGQSKTILLAEGSRITLGPRSAVDVRFGAEAREIFLRAGQMLLEAKQNTMPLILRARDLELHTNSGTYCMERRSRSTRVIAVNNSAVVSCGGLEPTTIESGQLLSFDGTTLNRQTVDAVAETAWTKGKLIVDSQSLAEVVDRIRPWFAGAIRLDPSLDSLKITGVFPLNNIPLALSTIAAALEVSIDHITPYWINIVPNTNP